MEKVENLGRRNLFRGRVSKENVLRLPWVISEEVFTSNCDQCQDCISVCETNIITRDSNGYPKVDFSKGECTFCNKCNEVCEKPLFHQNKESNPWPATISLLDKCLAKNQVFCQSHQGLCYFQQLNAIVLQKVANGLDQWFQFGERLHPFIVRCRAVCWLLRLRRGSRIIPR